MVSERKRPSEAANKSPKPTRRKQYHGIYARWVKSKRAWCWRPAVRVEGDLIWGRTYPTQKEAFEAFLRMKQEGQIVKGSPTSTMTLAEAGDEHITRLLGESGGSERTADGYRKRFAKWYEILREDALAAEVAVDDIRHLIRERRRLHDVHDNGVIQDLRVLHAVFATAAIPADRNPARKWSRQDPTGIRWPKAKDPARPFFTMEKLGALAHRIQESGTPAATFHSDLLVFLAITGIRAFEFERLRSGDLAFHPDGGIIFVRGKKGTGVREVEFIEDDAQLVRRMAERCEGKPILTASGLATVLKRWATRLKEPNLNARVLRRSYATHLEPLAGLRTVQDQLGHTQLTTTQKYLGRQRGLARDAAAQRHRQLHSE